MTDMRIMPNTKLVTELLKRPKRRGYCPVCDRPSHHHVHQQCGAQLEAAHRARRKGAK